MNTLLSILLQNGAQYLSVKKPTQQRLLLTTASALALLLSGCGEYDDEDSIEEAFSFDSKIPGASQDYQFEINNNEEEITLTLHSTTESSITTPSLPGYSSPVELKFTSGEQVQVGYFGFGDDPSPWIEFKGDSATIDFKDTEMKIIFSCDGSGECEPAKVELSADLMKGHFYVTGGGNTFIGGEGFYFISYEKLETSVSVSLDQQKTIHLYNGFDEPVDSLVNMARVAGSQAADEIRGDHNDNYLSGEGGNDELYGGAGDDWLYGDSGDDTLYGGADNDWLYGDSGDDRLYGGEGADTASYYPYEAEHAVITKIGDDQFSLVIWEFGEDDSFLTQIELLEFKDITCTLPGHTDESYDPCTIV